MIVPLSVDCQSQLCWPGRLWGTGTRTLACADMVTVIGQTVFTSLYLPILV